MSRRRSLARLATSLVVVFVSAGCSGGAEQSILSHFFTAARLRDNTTLGSFAMVSFEPTVRGTVTTFTIDSVTPEQRKPLALRELARAQEDAKAADAEFMKRKQAYEDENLDAIQRVLKAGKDAKLKGKDAEVQVAWTKFVSEGAELSRKMADARRRLIAESDIVELSVEQPGKTIDVTRYDGDLVSKDVTVTAPVKLPTGETVKKTMVFTLSRAELRNDKETLTGRWIVASMKDLTTPGATKTS